MDAKKRKYGEITLVNTLDYPFNNSSKSVALEAPMKSKDYAVISEIVSADGSIGRIEVCDKLLNGFKIGYTGSASSVVLKYAVLEE